MQSPPLTIQRQQTEWNTIKIMAQNYNFPENLITNLKVQIKQQKSTKHRIKTTTKNGQPSLTTAQKLEDLPISSNIPT